ncbi:unnamed protein product [Rhizoctonia solani]|uniref:Uncharacterized protein n=1 Tax=Rhizoctonia solani TaxID=456999 RepID=A0A8H3DW06_9AGAM|nr:unnamed protein product [Rhizoctonia solani]
MSSTSATSTSLAFPNQAPSEAGPMQTRAPIDPHILADLKNSENCVVDQLLGVLLKRCRESDPPANPSTNPHTNPSTPRIPQSADNSRNSSRNSSSTVAISPATSTPEDTINDTFAVSRNPFESCLQETVKICNRSDSKIQGLIDAYQSGYKEKPRYQLFVEFANSGLELVEPLKLSGFREPSSSKILFQVNNNSIAGVSKASRYPDIVLVPLASAKRVRGGFQGDWKERAKGACAKGSRDSFKWIDVLISGEMMWCHSDLHVQRPQAYITDVERPIRPIQPLPTHLGGDFIAITKTLSASNGQAISGTPTLPLPATSGSTHDPIPCTTQAEDSASDIS